MDKYKVNNIYWWSSPESMPDGVDKNTELVKASDVADLARRVLQWWDNDNVFASEEYYLLGIELEQIVKEGENGADTDTKHD